MRLSNNFIVMINHYSWAHNKNIMDKKKYCLQDFQLLSVFGYGNYSKVALVRKKDDQKIYAMKVIKKENKVKGVKKSHAFTQKDILTKSSHPFVIKLHATFQDSKRLFFIQDYCPGGQLFSLIKRVRRISQQTCRFYAAQIFLALDYLHSIKIVYRDLKPQNIVFDERGYLRLVDFGLCAQYKSCSAMSNRDLAGTAYFLPPEAFDKEHELGYEADWWSFGSLIFQMIAGFPPFFSQKDDIATTINKIKNTQPPLQLINSQPLKNFLKLLLEKNPQKRLGHKKSDELRNHPWLRGVSWEKIIRRQEVAPFIPKLSNDQDISFFTQDTKPSELSPPEQEIVTEQYYKSFSLSWKSSNQKGSGTQKESSPIEICLNIEDSELLAMSVEQHPNSFSNC